MSVDTVIDIARETLTLIIKCSAPMLLTSLIVGLVISIFQTITSIQEQTLTFVPKVVGMFACLMLLGHWMLNNMTTFMTDLWGNFSIYIR